MNKSDYIVAFVGLPSSGKSSIINSLIFKRVLQSGVCRTTTEVKLIEEEIFDDDNNKFKVIDLPGICDSEETDNDFNVLTYNHVTDANLIIWVSDVHKAFITTHEVNEYYKLKKYLKDIEDDTGRLYNVIIMLSKCNKDITATKKVKPEIISAEIEDSDEDTDINDMIDNVKNKFKDEDIILFNAYGRSYYHKNSSDILKKFVSRMLNISNNNINFNISKYIKNSIEYQEESYYTKFSEIYNAYLTDDKLNNKLIFALYKVDIYNISQHLKKIIEYFNHIEWDNPKNILSIENKKHFDYLFYIDNNEDYNMIKSLDNNENKINYNSLHSNIQFYIIKWCINVICICEINDIFLNDKNINDLNNQGVFYTINNLVNVIILYYSKLSLKLKLIIYKDLLFNNVITNLELNINILKFLNRNEINFKKLFIDFVIKTNDPNIFKIFYKKISKLIDINIQEDINELNNLLSDTNNELLKINNIYNLYIKFNNKLLNNEDYILLRKLKSLIIMYYPQLTKCFKNFICEKDMRNCGCESCYNKMLDIHIVEYQNIIFSYIPRDRLYCNTVYNMLINSIERKIYHTLLIEYNNNISPHYNKFIPINKLELLYSLD